METLVELIGSILLELLQELWPPVLAVLTGALVLLLGFSGYLYFAAAQPVRAVGCLVAAIVFLVLFVAGFKTGVYTRRTTKKQRNRRRK